MKKLFEVFSKIWRWFSMKKLVDWFGLNRTTVVLRTVWICAGIGLLSWVAYRFFNGENPHSHVSFKDILLSFTALVWAVHSELSKEFISKYQHLVTLHDDLRGWVKEIPQRKNKGPVFWIDEKALNFAESCICYRLQDHESLLHTFNDILSHLYQTRKNNKELYDALVSSYPTIDGFYSAVERKMNWENKWERISKNDSILSYYRQKVENRAA